MQLGIPGYYYNVQDISCSVGYTHLVILILLACLVKKKGEKRASVTRSEETNYFGESDKVV